MTTALRAHRGPLQPEPIFDDEIWDGMTRILTLHRESTNGPIFDLVDAQGVLKGIYTAQTLRNQLASQRLLLDHTPWIGDKVTIPLYTSTGLKYRTSDSWFMPDEWVIPPRRASHPIQVRPFNWRFDAPEVDQ